MKKLLLLLIPALLVFGSCAKEKGTKRVGGDEREVEMKFLTQGTTSRAATASEKAVHHLALLVFDGPEATSKFLYKRYAWKKSSDENSFRTTLKMGTGLTIYFAVNSEDMLEDLESTVLVEDTTWEDIYKAMVMDNPTGIDPADGLPMWGRLINQTVADKPLNDLGTVSLIRSVASTDIMVKGTNFDLKEGYLAFAADKGYLPYDASKLTTIEGLTQLGAPVSPAGMKSNIDLQYTVPDGESDISNVFYMYDNTASLTPADGDNRPTKVVLKGIWKDAAGKGTATYYPLAIRGKNKITGEYEKRQVTRNYKYTIIVTNVNGDGYDTLEEAKDADDVNADYTVVEWNDNLEGDIMIDGTKYFALPSKKAYLSRSAGYVAKLWFETNFKMSDIKMTFSDSVDTVAGEIDTHSRFKIETVSESGETYFKITSKLPYGTTDNPATLIVTAGRLKFNLHIEQRNSTPEDWQDGGNQNEDL